MNDDFDLLDPLCPSNRTDDRTTFTISKDDLKDDGNLASHLPWWTNWMKRGGADLVKEGR